jgi:hypothetical protein
MMMLTLLTLAWFAAAAIPAIDDPPTETTATVVAASYHTHDQLTRRLKEMTRSHRNTVSLSSIATTNEGRTVHLVEIALPSTTKKGDRPALLVVAGLEGTRILASEVAVGIIEELLQGADGGDDSVRSLLETHTIFVAPRMNPDAIEQYFADVKTNRVRTMIPDDQDRDGRLDEDGPNDLDGNGIITMMRVHKGDEADHFPDPADERLNVKARPLEGERAAFALYVEGIDDDGDGQYNEDPVGGLDLNMNFMHGYPEHADGAGAYPLSAPEALGLVDFAIAHPRITTILVLDKHDTLTSPPSTGGTHKSGTPKVVVQDDVDLYRVISEKFKATTGLEDLPGGGAWDGTFLGWAYAQYGVPVFATSLWTIPGEKAPDEDKPTTTDDGLTPSPVGDISMETLEELREAAKAQGQEVNDEMISQLTPEMVERFATMAGVEVQRVTTTAVAPSTPKDDGKPRDETHARQLAYSDASLDGGGFVEWAEFDHPTLGIVEIGGFAPYLATVPDPEVIPALAKGQAAFVLELARMVPEVSLEDVTVKQLGRSLWEIKAAAVNDGFLPTATAMGARSRGSRPVVVRLGTLLESIVAGQRVTKIWKIPGSGGRHELRWIVVADAGDTIDVTLYSERLGESIMPIVLQEEGEK